MIIRSPFPDVDIPEISFADFVLHRHPKPDQKPALIDGQSGAILTYAELSQSVRRTAAGLRARGFKQGEVFGILSHNAPEFAIAFLAVVSLGGVMTPINPLYTEEEAGCQLRDACARFLLSAPILVPKALGAARFAGIEETFVIGQAEGATPFAELMKADEPLSQLHVAMDDVVVLPYSSGTTGLPKGVMLTHRNLVANLRQMEGSGFFHPDDTLICFLPLYHIYGLMVILSLGLSLGSTIVLMPRFNLEGFLSLAQQFKATIAHVVPPIILSLVKDPLVDQYDLSSLHTIFSGAAPLSDSLTRACMDRLGCQVRQGYGMTETSPVTHSSPADPEQIKLGSVGVTAPNTECKIVDLEDGRALGPLQDGEICVRGPQVMKGYLNRPDETRRTIDEEGWLHTGDIGYVDHDGHFFVVDRAKELIKYKGFQVAPAELEAVLLTHPAIADAAVVPSPDEEAGEVPAAFVVLKSETDPEAIIQFVAERVAPFKRIRHVAIIDQIPKSPSGKILRRVLRERRRSPAGVRSER